MTNETKWTRMKGEFLAALLIVPGWGLIVHGIASWWGDEWYWIGSGLFALVGGLVLLFVVASEVED